MQVGSNSMLSSSWIEFNTIQVNSVEFNLSWIDFHLSGVKFDP